VMGGVDGKSSSRQMVEHNLLGTVNMLEYCKRHRAGLILLSTSRVCSIAALNALPMGVKDSRFAPTGTAPGLTEAGVTESFSTTAPISLYGSTKLASEALALEYGAAFDFPVYVNRCGVLAGAGQFGTAEQGIFSWWIHAWRARLPLRYIGFGGEGFQVRDALHPNDLARLIAMQISNTGPGKPLLLHLGGGMDRSMSLAELSVWCAGAMGAHEVGREENGRPFDVPWLVMDSSLARSAWGWQPEISIESTLEEIARHAADHPDWITRANA
jgi:CDP-paratose 2-epimerase